MLSSGVLPPAVRPPQFSSVQIKGGAPRHARTEQGVRPPQFSSVQIKGGARRHAPTMLALACFACFALLCFACCTSSGCSGPAFYKMPKQNAAVQARYFVRFNNW